MTPFNLEILRRYAAEGIARHGLRGYARKLEVDMGTLRSLQDGRDMQTSKLVKLCTAMGLGLSLSEQPSLGTGAGFSEPGGPTGSTRSEALHSGYLPIPYHTIERQFDGAAPVAFARHWLATEQLDSEYLSCVIAPDDRLSPSIRAGALCLLDSKHRRVTTHAIWARLVGGALSLEYLSQPTPGTMLISTSDPRQPAQLLTGAALDELRLLGRVVWSGTAMHFVS